MGTDYTYGTILGVGLIVISAVIVAVFSIVSVTTKIKEQAKNTESASMEEEADTVVEDTNAVSIAEDNDAAEVDRETNATTVIQEADTVIVVEKGGSVIIEDKDTNSSTTTATNTDSSVKDGIFIPNNVLVASSIIFMLISLIILRRARKIRRSINTSNSFVSKIISSIIRLYNFLYHDDVEEP